MRNKRPKKTAGLATVELALVAPVLVFLLFAFAELSWLLADIFILNAAARAGAREAAVGATTSEITDRVQSVASSLDQDSLTITLQYRVKSGDQWGQWQTLGDTTQGSQTVNDAPSGAQVRVQLTYEHQLLVHGLFRAIADPDNPQVRTVTVSAVMRRE